MKSVRLPTMLLVLLVCAQLAGPWCWSTADGEEIIRQGVLFPYEITGPDGWVYASKPHQYVLGVFEPEGEDIYPYISLTLMGGAFQRHFTPEELVQRNLYERPGAHLISSRWIERENGDYLLAEFGWSSEMGDIRAIKAFHPRERQILVVSAVSLATDFDQYQPAFLESVMSVQVKEHPDQAEEHRKAAVQATSDDDWLYDDQ